MSTVLAPIVVKRLVVRVVYRRAEDEYGVQTDFLRL